VDAVAGARLLALLCGKSVGVLLLVLRWFWSVTFMGTAVLRSVILDQNFYLRTDTFPLIVL